MMKLTEAQHELLADVGRRTQFVAGYYPPARKLVKMGLCTWTDTGWLAITDAGRTALREDETT